MRFLEDVMVLAGFRGSLKDCGSDVSIRMPFFLDTATYPFM